MSRLRSFLRLADVRNLTTVSSLVTLSSGFKLLRVLDLRGARIDNVPESLYHLYNLHYLSLRGTNIEEISESLGNLCNLETLDLSFTLLKRLPRSIIKLKKLRHLTVGTDWSFAKSVHGYWLDWTAVKIPKGLWKLKELQTLGTMEATDEFVRHMENLVKIRSLIISGVKPAHCAKLGNALSQMAELRNLAIVPPEEEDGEILDLDTLNSPPQYLQKLTIGGRLKNDKLPHWFCSLRNVKMLSLERSRLREDTVLSILGSLPNLVFLQLVDNAYEGNEICFRVGWFPKLKSLVIITMPLKQLVIEGGALTKLEKLYIVSCPQLNDVPSGIEHLTNLQSLHLFEPAPELESKLQMDTDACRRIRKILQV